MYIYIFSLRYAVKVTSLECGHVGSHCTVELPALVFPPHVRLRTGGLFLKVSLVYASGMKSHPVELSKTKYEVTYLVSFNPFIVR